MATAKKTKRVVEAEGIAHVSATFNNTTITITDMHGNTVSWGSAGKAGFKGSKKSTPFAATVASEQCAREALTLGVRELLVADESLREKNCTESHCSQRNGRSNYLQLQMIHANLCGLLTTARLETSPPTQRGSGHRFDARG